MYFVRRRCIFGYVPSNFVKCLLTQAFLIAYVFWSIFTALPLALFYFSIWELGIAGSELSLLSILSPCLLGIGLFRRWCQTKPGRVILHIFSLSALVAYALPKPHHRLLLVALGNVFLSIGAAVDWSAGSGSEAEYQAIRAYLVIPKHQMLDR